MGRKGELRLRGEQNPDVEIGKVRWPMSRPGTTLWSSLLLFIVAGVTWSCASGVSGSAEGAQTEGNQAWDPGTEALDDGESLAAESGTPPTLANTPALALRPPVTLARIPGLIDFDFEGGTLVYRKSSSLGTMSLCTVPDCVTSWTLAPLSAGSVYGPHVSIAQGRVYYPYRLSSSPVQIRSMGLGGEGDRAEASQSYSGVAETVNFFGGDANQIADVFLQTPAGSDFKVLSASPPAGRSASIPRASRYRHTNGDGSIEILVQRTPPNPGPPVVTIGPSLVTVAVTVPDWPAGDLDEIATSPRTVRGAPALYPAVGMVEHSGGSRTVRICPTATDCAAWISVGSGTGIGFTGTHLYIGSSTGLDRCKLSEIGRFGTCTREALVRGGPVTDLHITETHVVYRSGTQVRAACKSPSCSGNTCLDWLKNGTESDVDCGGSCLRRCELGRTCKVHSDCATGRCDAGVCVVGAAEVSLGVEYTCARLLDGRMKCWGDMNSFGQLGLGHNSQPVRTPTPLDLGQGRTAAGISAGYTHTCAVLDDSTIKCWGGNSSGQLGLGNTTNLNAPGAAVNLGAGRSASSVSAGGHTCALLDDATVKCWGPNASGQLGVGNTTDRSAPGPIARLGSGRTALQIATGASHSCAVLDDAALKCWGDNTYGQLGVGNNTSLDAPGAAVNLGSGRTAKAIALGNSHTCALLDDDSLKCWGYNAYGQLGTGTSNLNAPGASVTFGPGRTTKAIGIGATGSCAVMDDDSLRCWGTVMRLFPTTPVDLGR